MGHMVLYRSGSAKDFAWFRVGDQYQAEDAEKKRQELADRGFFAVIVDERNFCGLPKTYNLICPACGGTGIHDAAGHDRNCRHCRGRGTLSSSKAPRRRVRSSLIIPASALQQMTVAPFTLPHVASSHNCNHAHEWEDSIEGGFVCGPCARYQYYKRHGPFKTDTEWQAEFTKKQAPSAEHTQGR